MMPTYYTPRTRTELLTVLDLAAQLEHDLMCQYLFAAYSLKQRLDEGVDEIQLERIRRWGSEVTFVARQEMEHLGIVMNLRTAIGGAPYFGRANFPQPLHHYGLAEIRSELTRFSADTIRRFRAYEAPEPTPDDWRSWCSGDGSALEEPTRRTLGAPVGEAADWPPSLTYENIQQLYLSLDSGFTFVADKIGHDNLFIGPERAQLWGGAGNPYGGSMDNLNQYGLDIVKVTCLDEAHEAIFEIIEQGEGIAGPPSYREHTHYCIFAKILEEMAEHAEFDPARPVVSNPMLYHHPGTDGDEVNLISCPETREVAKLFNHVYELMLSMLMELYGNWDKTAEQKISLINAVFFPLMTMFVRPLAEILTQLPAFTDSEDAERRRTAGPGFELSGKVLVLPDPVIAEKIYAERMEQIIEDLDSLAIYGMKSDYPEVVGRLKYISENMRRLRQDWVTHWSVVGGTGL